MPTEHKHVLLFPTTKTPKQFYFFIFSLKKMPLVCNPGELQTWDSRGKWFRKFGGGGGVKIPLDSKVQQKYWNILTCKGVTALLVREGKKKNLPDNSQDVLHYFNSRKHMKHESSKGANTTNWLQAVTLRSLSSLIHNSPCKVKREI